MFYLKFLIIIFSSCSYIRYQFYIILLLHCFYFFLTLFYSCFFQFTWIFLFYLSCLYISLSFSYWCIDRFFQNYFRSLFQLAGANRSINNAVWTLESIKLLRGAQSCRVVFFSYVSQIYAYVAFIVVIMAGQNKL